MSKIKYEIIFEERTIFDENYDELWLPNSVGFLDIHHYEYDDDESSVYDNHMHKGFDEIFPDSLVIYLGYEKGYKIITEVPTEFMESAEPSDFDQIESFEEKDYDKALNYIKNLEKISFSEAKNQGLWAEDDEDEEM